MTPPSARVRADPGFGLHRVAQRQQLVEDRLGGAAGLRPAQRRQAGNDVVVGVGEARGDDHRGEGRRVETVGRVEHPQEVERPHLVGRRRTVAERRQHPFGEAAARLRIAWLTARTVAADRADQGRHLPDHPQLAPLALAARDRRPPSARDSRRPTRRRAAFGSGESPDRGLRISSTTSSRQPSARPDLAPEVDKALGIVTGSLAGDEQVRDLLEVGLVGEGVDRHPAVGELTTRWVEPHHPGLGGDNPGESGTDIGRHRPVDICRPPVESGAECA